MTVKVKPPKLSVELAKLMAVPQLSLHHVLQQLKTASFGFLLALVSLPSALPIPAPGLSVPLGVLIIILSAQLLWGRKTVWIPKKWRHASFNTATHQPHVNTMLKFVRFFEWFIRPRLSFIYLIGLPVLVIVMLLCGVSMLIPIPGTNTLPAFGVFLIGLGMIEKDGLAAMVGLLFAVAGLALSVLVLWFGTEAVGMVVEVVKGLWF